MYRAIERVLLSEEQIRARIQELGQQLTADYREKNPIFVGILKGVVDDPGKKGSFRRH